jgi:Rps23 Pro-64 3,4-dihydroxylase Tpa1-like proline 4-hydroxylase
MNTPTSTQILSYTRWSRELPVLRQRYTTAEPFPHIVLDNFLEREAAEQALAEFPPMDSADWLHYKHLNQNKQAKIDRSTFGPLTGLVFDELNSDRFLQFLSQLTGISSLIPDHSLHGGGLHQSGRGGFLNIHADFTVHPYHPDWQRRVNAIVYLNKNWDDSYSGHLELWDRLMQRCEQKIAPVFNRCVIFNTDVDSFHGLPDPLTCPEGVTRKSLALYYFTQETKPLVARSTEYRARPDDGFRRVWIYLDKMTIRLYHTVKSRFGLSDKLASRIAGFVFRPKGK